MMEYFHFFPIHHVLLFRVPMAVNRSRRDTIDAYTIDACTIDVFTIDACVRSNGIEKNNMAL